MKKIKTILIILAIILLAILLWWFFAVDKKTSNEGNNWEKYPLNLTIGYHICENKYEADCLQKEEYEKVTGDKESLLAFSILPGGEVSDNIIIQGWIKNSYFFEGNILVNILDSNKKNIKQTHANSVTEWMTDGPVEFQGEVDFSYLPKGNAYIEIHNDNASGLPENDKSILIPIVIK